MNEEIVQGINLFEQTYGNYVFYCTDELESYIDNAVAYVGEGISGMDTFFW